MTAAIGQNQKNREQHDRNNRGPGCQPIRLAKTGVDNAVHPAHATPVEQLRGQPLDNKSDE